MEKSKEVEVKQTERLPLAVKLSLEQAERLPLAVKLSLAQRDIGPVTKDGHNKAVGYPFQSEGAIKAAVKDALSNYLLTIIPSAEVLKRWEEKTAKGGTMHYVTVRGHYDITDGYNHIEGSMVADGMDTGDKALTKAATTAQKYFYKELFNISDKDAESDEVDSGDQNNIGYNQPPQNGNHHNRSRPQRRDNVRNLPNSHSPVEEVQGVWKIINRQFGDSEANRIMFEVLGSEGFSDLDELVNANDRKKIEVVANEMRSKAADLQQQNKNRRGAQ